tara:strand:- start:1102 stop:1434 length:333 start_codon:yes stop_codon:yes gene_type:complete
MDDPADIYEDWQTTPYQDECRRIIAEMLKQAVRDYLNLDKSKDKDDQEDWKFAEAFLFEEEYRVDWGGKDRSLEEFLGILGIEVEPFREQLLQRKEQLDHVRRKKMMIED